MEPNVIFKTDEINAAPQAVEMGFCTLDTFTRFVSVRAAFTGIFISINDSYRAGLGFRLDQGGIFSVWGDGNDKIMKALKRLGGAEASSHSLN